MMRIAKKGLIVGAATAAVMTLGASAASANSFDRPRLEGCLIEFAGTHFLVDGDHCLGLIDQDYRFGDGDGGISLRLGDGDGGISLRIGGGNGDDGLLGGLL